MQLPTSEVAAPVGAIAGLEKLTLVDFPGRVAATVFLGGCNLRCPFCHNPGLVLGPWRQLMTPEHLGEWLRERAGFLDGLCITGGEPTLAPARLAAICRVARDAGMAVKVDTNGTRPQVVERLLGDGLVDFVAVDVKASPAKYRLAAGVSVDTSAIERTVALLRDAGMPHELRTTVVPGIHDADDIRAIGQWLAGPSSYVIQAFRPGNTLDTRWSRLSAPSPELLEGLAAVAGEFFLEARTRV